MGKTFFSTAKISQSTEYMYDSMYMLLHILEVVQLNTAPSEHLCTFGLSPAESTDIGSITLNTDVGQGMQYSH